MGMVFAKIIFLLPTVSGTVWCSIMPHLGWFFETYLNTLVNGLYTVNHLLHELVEDFRY